MCVEPEPRSVLPAVHGVWWIAALLSQLGDAALYFALRWAAFGIGWAAGLML